MVLGGSLRFGSCRAALRVAGVLVKRVAVDACCRWFPLRLMLAVGSHRGRLLPLVPAAADVCCHSPRHSQLHPGQFPPQSANCVRNIKPCVGNLFWLINAPFTKMGGDYC